MAPEHVAIVEWDSVKDAVGFYKSKAWADMEPERKKYQKIVRRYFGPGKVSPSRRAA